MDSSVKPGDDFFDYVNGAWAKRTEIAPDRTFVGIDSVLNDQIDKDVRAIVEDTAKNPAGYGRIGQQVGDFYGSWMDEAAIAAKGAAPLKPYLDRIAAVKDKGDLVDLFATVGYESPVGVSIYPDLSQPTQYAVYAGQSGLGMGREDRPVFDGRRPAGHRPEDRQESAGPARRSDPPDSNRGRGWISRAEESGSKEAGSKTSKPIEARRS